MDKKQLDRALLALQSGMRGALSEIYDGLGRLILTTAYAITGNRQDAEDALQETMVQIVRYADRYRPGTNGRAWILTMTRHIALDMVRKRKDPLPLDAVAELSAPESSATEADALLAQLDPEQRQLVVLHLYAGMKLREIAGIMGLSLFATQKRYQRAMQKLRSYDPTKEEFR